MIWPTEKLACMPLQLVACNAQAIMTLCRSQLTAQGGDANTFGAVCQFFYDPNVISCMVDVVALQFLELMSSCVFSQHVVERNRTFT